MKRPAHAIGLDVHAETIAVAVAETGGEVRSLGAIPNRAESVRRLVGKLGKLASLRVRYEAGPTGYVLYWQLMELGMRCEVVAQTLVPVKAGDRVKTDRRDAEKLARCYSRPPCTPVNRRRQAFLPSPPVEDTTAADSSGTNWPRCWPGWKHRYASPIGPHRARNRTPQPLLEKVVTSENKLHGHPGSHPPLAGADTGGAAPAAPAAHSAEGGAQYGLRGGAGSPGLRGSATAPADATRCLDTSLGRLTYAELAPHLAQKVRAVEEAVVDGRYVAQPLDEYLIQRLHGDIAAELVPDVGGRWRSIEVNVGTHEPPPPHQVPMAMRDYARDLEARIAALRAADCSTGSRWRASGMSA